MVGPLSSCAIFYGALGALLYAALIRFRQNRTASRELQEGPVDTGAKTATAKQDQAANQKPQAGLVGAQTGAAVTKQDPAPSRNLQDKGSPVTTKPSQAWPDRVFALPHFGYDAGWRVEKHPRFLADLTGDGRADIVGFGQEGVFVALNKGNGTFANPRLVLQKFGYDAGGWRVEMHPRLLADLTGDGCADIVGFGKEGVFVSLNKGDGTFADPQLVTQAFGYDATWRVDMHPRFLADLTGDGRADIVGFGNPGVFVALNKGDGTFADWQLVLGDFGYEAGNWRIDMHPRFLADLTGDGRADIVGFGYQGVFVSLNLGNGTFSAPQFVLGHFGYEAGNSWRVDRHPRFLADLTGDGRADILGFGNEGVWVSLNKGDGTFTDPQLVLKKFGYEAGGWRVETHPRFLADLTGDGRADIVGFGNEGVWVSLNKGDGTFADPQLVVTKFGHYAGSWRIDRHPCFLADITGDGRADIVGFGNAGVYTCIAP